MRSWSWRLPGFLLSGFVVAALAVLVLRLFGYFVVVHKSGGRLQGTAPPVFGRVGEIEPLPAGEPSAKPRNLVLLIADGMGPAHVAATRALVAGPDGRLFFERMPVLASISTHSRSRLVPDSASAATAMATGWKTDNGMVSALPGGLRPRTLAEAALARGLEVGLVTTSYLPDATPAAFVAHVEDRAEVVAVSRQMAASGVSLLLGGLPEEITREEARQLPEIFRGAGWSLAASWGELQGLERAPRVAALFPPETVRRADQEPSLRQLAAFALDRLRRAPAGFLLVVETEETDTASHDQDFERMAAGLAEFDAVARAAVELARTDGETLVVLTADHETGGLSLISGSDERRLGVRWSTTSHTGVPVPLYAYGAGAGRLATLRDNTELGRALAELLELDLGTPAAGAPPGAR